jgi:gamma-glutamylaminecyclotransferase
MSLIFVYGTLKRGGSNHHFMAGGSFAGNAQTPAGFTLYEIAGYPGMVREEGDREGVRGEVWIVGEECLADLDVLEGVDEGLYSREAVPLGAPFDREAVEAYIYMRGTDGRPRIGPEWPG